MKIGVDKHRNIVLREVYSGVGLETSEGNKLGICMRDDTFKINVIKPNGDSQWFRVDMENLDIVKEVVSVDLADGDDKSEPCGIDG